MGILFYNTRMPPDFQIRMCLHIVHDPDIAKIPVSLILHLLLINGAQIPSAPLAAKCFKHN